MSNKLNTLGLTSNIGVQLTDSEFKTLALAIWMNSQNKNKSKRAGTTTEANATYLAFKETTIGKQLNKVELYGDYKYAYEKASQTTLDILSLPVSIDTIDNVISTLNANVSDVKSLVNDKERAEQMVIVNEKNLNVDLEKYRYIFRMLNSYDCELIGAKKTKRANGKGDTEVSITFEFSHKGMNLWKLELPMVSKAGKFVRNGSEYIVNLMPTNLEAYAMGEEDVLVLKHAYTYMIEQILTVYTENTADEGVLCHYYSKEVFENMINFVGKDGRIRALQNKVVKMLNNAKDNYTAEKTNSPIMWVDKHTSDFGRVLSENTVGVFADYNLMMKVSKKFGQFVIPGLDLLTGSTSEPAKRCRIAVGYKIGYVGHKMCVLPKEDNLSELATIFSDYKFMNPGTLRTSSKRDNSCTLVSTYNLVNPQTRIKRVTLSVK